MISKILLQLLRKDLLQFRRKYPGKFFDTCFIFFTNVVVFGYFMPAFGGPANYGPFILIGAIASFGLFDIIGQVGELILDIEGDRKITFTLSMPIPSWVVFIQLVLKWAITTFILFIPLFFIGKLLLWNQFYLSQINLFQLILIYPSVCFFFGFFSLWLTSVIQKMDSLSSLFCRFLNPIFMFGGYFFSWQASFDLSPIVGYALLANPMIYATEGMRAATLGQTGYLPFWTCFFALWGFNLLLGAHAIFRLKRRLDCV